MRCEERTSPVSEGDDGDLVIVDDGEDAPAGVDGPDAQVVHPATPAQTHPATTVDEVGAEPERPLGTAPGRVRLRPRPVGLAGGPAPDGPVRTLLVVGEAEGIELGLQLGQGPRCGPLPEPALLRLVEALDLALGLGMARRPVLQSGCRSRRAGARRRCARR
jgi:hypothetical protein